MHVPCISFRWPARGTWFRWPANRPPQEVFLNQAVPPQVRALADGATLAAEQVAAPWTTLANMSRAPPVCLVTDSGGVGTLLYRHDGRDQRYRLGPFGWYLESAEFESGEIWDRGAGGAWALKYAYAAREAERRCYADFEIEVAPARTDSFYTFLHSQVMASFRCTRSLPQCRMRAYYA